MLGKCQKNICIQTKFFRPSERRLSVHLSDLQLSSFKIRILHILQKLSQGIKKNLYFCQMKSIYFLILTSRKLIKNPYELHCPFRNCYCLLQFLESYFEDAVKKCKIGWGGGKLDHPCFLIIMKIDTFNQFFYQPILDKKKHFAQNLGIKGTLPNRSNFR